MRYIIGLIGFPLGILLIVYRERVKRFTGSFAWGERWFGPGGTYTAYVLIGILISVGSLLYMFGVIQNIFLKFLGPLFPPI